MEVSYTARQGQFLAFIHDYTKLNGRPPAEADMQRHFGITPPSVHQMVLTLEKRKLIARTPGQARSIRLLIPLEHLSTAGAPESLHLPDPEAVLGHWRITHMDMWDQDFVDAEVEGYVRLDHGGSGEFQFGYVYGRIDYELTERGGKPAAEWLWEGSDEMDVASGRGWAALEADGTLKGKLSFHRGDRSEFLAVKKGKPKPSAAKKMWVLSDKPRPPKEP